MAELTYDNLLESGVHFGHLTQKWNPKMAPYIFMEKNGIHLIDLNKTLACLDEAKKALKVIVKSGRRVMFVATKKQAKELVAHEAGSVGMPYVTERWLGGMLTNFATVRKSLKKMASMEKMMKDESFDNLAKKEKLMVSREKAKMEKTLGGIANQTRLPAAIFVVDVVKEHIAVSEANKLNIPVFGLVDTNADPDKIDFPIPANDDAYKSVAILTQEISKAIEEAQQERKVEKEEQQKREQEQNEGAEVTSGGEEQDNTQSSEQEQEVSS